VHLVGFIIRIYHDARSPECQISNFISTKTTDSCKYDANDMHKLKVVLVRVNKKKKSVAPSAAAKQHIVWFIDASFLIVKILE